MLRTTVKKALFVSLILFLFSSPTPAQKKKSQPSSTGSPVIWRDPGDISKRNLNHGTGSAELAPAPPFTYVKEETTGESPKFNVRDARGDTWVVKLGPEAQSETVATRLVWAVGYFADEAYYLDRAEIKNLPKLSRGQDFVENGSVVRGARFEPKRKHLTRGSEWEWEKNPFVGTRELDGLKVLMVLLGNYDTSVRNNRIVHAKNAATGAMEARYVVTDIGATLGKVGGLGGKRSKNTLADFRSSKFVLGTENGMVKFDYSTTPKKMGAFASIFSPGYRSSQAAKERAMKNITVENARWIGSLLSKLSDEQLRDAFRAANYDRETMEGYVSVLRDRIEQLIQLKSESPTAGRAR